jgi:hypothetical protein
MKLVTSQDTKWTRLQTTQGLKHQHAKLWGLGCLPTRLTQPERYSHSSRQHDLSVQIRRLKQPLMEKVWLPKLWASTIPLIWTCGRSNSDKEARRYGPRNPCCAVSPKSEQIIFRGRFGDLIFVSKERNEYQSWRISWRTTWTPNLHYLESERGRYDAGKEGLWIRKIWTRLILWKPSLLLSQGGSRARQGGARPKAPQGNKYNPLGALRWLPIDIHSSESRHKMRDEIRWVRRKDQCRRREGSKRTPSRWPRVFPSFIAAIFINDVLRSLQHPYVLQSL